METSERSHLLDFLSHFLIQDPSLAEANFLLCKSIIQKLVSLIFIDLHKLEKNW